jgi:hypothetical protein
MTRTRKLKEKSNPLFTYMLLKTIVLNLGVCLITLVYPRERCCRPRARCGVHAEVVREFGCLDVVLRRSMSIIREQRVQLSPSYLSREGSVSRRLVYAALYPSVLLCGAVLDHVVKRRLIVGLQGWSTVAAAKADLILKWTIQWRCYAAQ